MDSSKKHGKTAQIAWIGHGASMENTRKVIPSQSLSEPFRHSLNTCEKTQVIPGSLMLFSKRGGEYT